MWMMTRSRFETWPSGIGVSDRQERADRMRSSRPTRKAERLKVQAPDDRNHGHRASLAPFLLPGREVVGSGRRAPTVVR